MQIPIVNGIYTDAAADFRTAYPKNLIVVPKEQGISAGYLRPADGIVSFGTGPGIDRGGINWNDKCYRVMGNQLVYVDPDGNVNSIGYLPGSSQVTLDYSTDYLAIAADGNFYLYNTSLQQVTDPDLGRVDDFVWIDGYFVTTDGSYLVVTELNNPFSVVSTKYGSSEADPDQIIAVQKIQNELYAINRYTIEAFKNIGGTGFPFQRIDGAHMMRGAIGAHACCQFYDAIAFLGGGKNEAPAVWLGAQGQTTKISSREVEQAILDYDRETLAEVLLETRVDKGLQQLWVHLPDCTFVYDVAASAKIGSAVWSRLTTSDGQYRAKNMTWCYDKWIVGDPKSVALGTLSDTISSHWGVANSWEFSTPILFNETQGAIIHELEIVCLTGRVTLGTQPVVWTQWSNDGRLWSMPRSVRAGEQGDYLKRLAWLQQGMFKNWRIQKFFGTSDAHLSTAFLDARIERLAY